MKIISTYITTQCLIQSTSAFVSSSESTTVPQTPQVTETTETSQIPQVMPQKSTLSLSLPDLFSDSIKPIPKVADSLESLAAMTFSKAIPFLQRPPLLNGELPGDAGFDPLRLAKTEEDLIRYREAEIKHGRLAMLCAVGWPFSEFFDGEIASFFRIQSALDSVGRAPSFLNDFTNISVNYWLAILVVGAFIDSYGIYRSTNDVGDKYFPGNLGFDPLGFFPTGEAERKYMQLAEIKHGRTAMIACLIYGIQEFFTGSSLTSIPFF